MATAIKVENLSKIYRLGEIGTGTISRDIERFVKTKILKQEDPFLRIGETNDRAIKGVSDIVYSLKDINFEIEQGDAVGIIGRNGAGKSTLLKILSRVTSPTAGKINIKGRVASLLEVGTGFHPELTGRENIYLNGAILGMRKREIDRKLDEIIDFSGVERYIDTPVKRYSSGMYVRLAFAVAAHLESEILIVDEVLAVGDAEFQKKCLGKMGEVSKGEGRTVLFVSHNMGAVRNLCKTGFVLCNGGLGFSGSAEKSVISYINMNKNNSTYKAVKKSEIYISRILPVNNHLIQNNSFSFSENPTLLIEIVNTLSKNNNRNIILSVALLDDLKNRVFTVEHNFDEMFNLNSPNTKTILLQLPDKLIAPGIYSFHLAIHKPNIELFDMVDDVCDIEIIENESIGRFKYSGVKQGSMIVKAEWQEIEYTLC
jgi:lipopolysaccharide transport system ATP-binding protein